MALKFSIKEINGLGQRQFVRIIGPVFEHSPWIAEETYTRRPFLSGDDLHKMLWTTVLGSGDEKLAALIRAHPDLVGKLAQAGKLTQESTNEQASAGLDKLTPEEISLFEKQNAAYKAKFGFPFIICARLNKKEAILRGFESRLNNSGGQEIGIALGEIFKIAELRLRDLISD